MVIGNNATKYFIIYDFKINEDIFPSLYDGYKIGKVIKKGSKFYDDKGTLIPVVHANGMSILKIY